VAFVVRNPFDVPIKIRAVRTQQSGVVGTAPATGRIKEFVKWLATTGPTNREARVNVAATSTDASEIYREREEETKNLPEETVIEPRSETLQYVILKTKQLTLFTPIRLPVSIEVRFSLVKQGEESATLGHVVTTICDIRAPLTGDSHRCHRWISYRSRDESTVGSKASPQLGPDSDFAVPDRARRPGAC
jgi:hypothetical protein